MTQLLNNAEGGSNTTTVTTGNSGGTSGSAFDGVTIGTSCAVTYDTAHVYETLGYNLTAGGTAATLSLEWNTSFGTQTTYYLRYYFYATANPSAARVICMAQNGATPAWRLFVNTTGKLVLNDQAGSGVYTSTNSIGLNQWVRLEMKVIHVAGANSTVEIALYNSPDSTTATEDVSTTSINVLTQSTKYYFGSNSGNWQNVTFWYDNLGLSTVGFLGPYVQNTAAPTVSGSAPTGSTLTAANGTWNGANQAFTYQWTRDGSNIGSATSSTYATVSADVGHAVGCKVTCTNSVTAEAATKASSNTVTVTSNPPVNTVAPVASGTATVGQTLSTTNGTWTGLATITFTYQWQRDTAGNLSFSNIGSATNSTYTLVDADDGNKVRCVVTGTNGDGNAAANSNALGLVVEPVPTNSVAPAVTGTTTVGQTLTSTTGTWANQGGSIHTYAYQWKRDAGGSGSYSSIGSATNSTYALVDADDGCHIKCTVIATNSGGAGTPTDSNIVGTVVEPVPANTVAPAVTGTATAGNTLTCSTGTWSNQGGTIATYAYQWKRDGTNIAGQTAATHVVVSADQGHSLTCQVTATNTGGAGTPALSNSVAVSAVHRGNAGAPQRRRRHTGRRGRR